VGPPGAPAALPTCAAGLALVSTGSGWACQLTCSWPRVDCDADASNGCEADLAGDTANCGWCGKRCAEVGSGVASCRAGSCVVEACLPGLLNCDGLAGNGCEVDGRVEPLHCGACGQACPAPPNTVALCQQGACAVGPCRAGFLDCDGQPSNGCEIQASQCPATVVSVYDLTAGGNYFDVRTTVREPMVVTGSNAGGLFVQADPDYIIGAGVEPPYLMAGPLGFSGLYLEGAPVGAVPGDFVTLTGKMKDVDGQTVMAEATWSVVGHSPFGVDFHTSTTVAAIEGFPFAWACLAVAVTGKVTGYATDFFPGDPPGTRGSWWTAACWWLAWRALPASSARPSGRR
jgi:hypothetical protein